MTKILKAMLTENTGRHMLDSGGAYGRSWQENQGRDFEAEPAATLTVEEGYIDIRRSTFHFLKECLEFDLVMNERFQAFDKAKAIAGPWLVIMEEFVESIDATGIYGVGKPIVVNTYDDKSRLLDEVLQYIYFELDEQSYVLLQLGCDLHDAYTAPKAFRCNIDNCPTIFDDGTVAIICKEGDGDHRWYYSGGRWDVDHYESADARFLNEFPIIADLTKYHKVREKSKVGESIPFGVIWQDGDGVHCPLCGEILEVW